ncbi:hypothetical protein [Pseudomonas sp. TWP3-2]|uniref:hypothetical protein n=1 Tax=Pseudomonas sp. TWP3-2 TaxID=2804574 RepID=UPI003CEB84FC
MRHYEIEGIDLRLPQVLVSPQVGTNIQSGKARLMVLPLRPQPSVCAGALARFGLESFSEEELMPAARVAFRSGLIPPPIGMGYAFELIREFVPEKPQKFGTGIVRQMGITRLLDITAEHWKLCGYSSREDFNSYWHQAAADLSEHPNPWCWLIEFTFKG